MIRPLRSYLDRQALAVRRPFPTLDRAFDAVEGAFAQLGAIDATQIRSPRLVEELLRPTALPEGTLLVIDPDEIAAARQDIEATVKDERQGGVLYLTLPPARLLAEQARALRELAVAASTYGFHAAEAFPAGRLGRVRQVALPAALRPYRFLLADTPGFRVLLISRVTPHGGEIALWTGNADLVDEVRAVLAEPIAAAGLRAPAPAAPVPSLDGIRDAQDVWRRAAELRAFRSVREAQLREVARQAALRGVELRRERERAERARPRDRRE